MKTSLSSISLVIGACALAASVHADAGWRSFKGRGFQVDYPATWSRIAHLPDQLDILSPGQREEGVVIGKGQAEISVRRLTPGLPVGSRINEWLKGSDVVTRQGRIANLHAPLCPSFEGVTADNNEGDEGHKAFD